MLSRVEIKPELQHLRQTERAAAHFPLLADGAVRQNFPRIRERVLRIVRVEPVKQSGQKTRWTSRKQQKAFHASDGFGAGIPTVRTHDYINAFDVVLNPASPGAGEIGVTNADPVTRYMPGGEEEQPYLVDAGWQNITQVLDDEKPGIEADLVNGILLKIDPTNLAALGMVD